VSGGGVSAFQGWRAVSGHAKQVVSLANDGFAGNTALLDAETLSVSLDR